MEIKEIINKFSDKKIAVIGDVMLDCFVYGTAKKLSQEAPVAVIQLEKEINYPGGAANVAVNIKSLGGDVILLGYIGEDSSGKKLKKLLDKKNLKNFLLPVIKTTIKKTRIIGDNQQIIRIDNEIKEFVKKEFEDDLINKISEINPEIIIISDYAKGAITQKLFDKIKKLNKKIIVDPKPNSIDYSGAYAITPNLKEGKEISNLKESNEIGRFLQKKYHSNIFLTKGKEGITLFSKEEKINLPTNAKEVYDVTGAGDSIIAGIALGLVSGLDLKDSAILANKIAGIVVEKKGTSVVSKEELERLDKIENNKLKTWEELKLIREDYAKKGKKVVFTNGCYDILHPGHIQLLKKAKSFGDVLILAINGDKSPFFKTKSGKRPILNQEERVEVLSGLDAVDYITIFNEDTPCEIISKLKPDIHVKGGDYNPENFLNMPEAKIIKEYGGEVKTIPIIGGYSTTKLIEKIKSIE